MPYSDNKLRQLADRSDELADQIADLKARKDIVDGKVLGELARRGVKTLTFEDGRKLTAVSNRNTQYDYEGILEELGPRVARRIQKRQVDPTLLAEQVTSGRIDSTVIAAHTEVTFSKAYLSTSG